MEIAVVSSLEQGFGPGEGSIEIKEIGIMTGNRNDLRGVQRMGVEKQSGHVYSFISHFSI